MTKALITGIGGQDGSYLAELLLEKGYEVDGLVHGSTDRRFEHLEQIMDRITLYPGDLLDEHSLVTVLRRSDPDEIYNLAAMSSVAESWRLAVATAEYTAVGVTRLLEGVREVCPQARFYQASSSEMFGRARESPQSERTPFYPRSPYGVAKVYGHFITVNYRESFGLHASSGILFNHESPRRGAAFVTRRISRGVASIKLGLSDELVLGNLDVRRDWGYAKEYVEAMWMILQRDEPDDFVIGTGLSHSVDDFVDAAFACVDLKREDHVRIDPDLARPADIEEVVANPAKAKRELGWEARVGFEELVEMMVRADLDALANGLGSSRPPQPCLHPRSGWRTRFSRRRPRVGFGGSSAGAASPLRGGQPRLDQRDVHAGPQVGAVAEDDVRILAPAVPAGSRSAIASSIGTGEAQGLIRDRRVEGGGRVPPEAVEQQRP